MTISQNAIILGFTGSLGSGCSYISNEICSISQKYKYFKLSDTIREALKTKGISHPSVKELQEEGNNLRREFGNSVLVKNLISDLQEKGDAFDKIKIDGIKNDHEIQFLRQLPNFYLFSVNADRDIRWRRITGQGKIFSSKVEFDEADKKDEKEDDPNGQQVKKCNETSDIILVNDKNYAATNHQAKTEFVRRIFDRYVKLIESSVSGRGSHESSPTIDELCMTIAYSLSKRSSCLKRKVGAVIIEEENLTIEEENEEHEKESEGKAIRIPNIVASGYNEVPIGTFKCIFDREYQKCYRDHLQEEHAKKMVYCPTCGTKIETTSTCQSCGEQYDGYIKFCTKCQTEIKNSYKCSVCGKNVFEEHLPGSKNTPGKLLDLCRALHGEEMAILQLSKRPSKSGAKLTMYVTTQPCNLCANKIATAGISKVVYSEPYTMKEAAEILENGGVEIKRFQGVKSSAYFKLYS